MQDMQFLIKLINLFW